jgi:hypothetical protein
MRNEARGRRRWALAVTVMLVAWGCGSNSNVRVNSASGCDGGSGPTIRGVVQMPKGRVAKADGLLERVAGAVWSTASALTGAVDPVGKGVTVELVELRPEDLASGTDPGPVEVTTTRKGGKYCIGLPEGTDENVCRYVVQVGDRSDATLTRAFVFSTDPADQIDIDFRSEAAVRVVLTEIPRADLCDFSPNDIRGIYGAVVVAPGTATGDNADELNAVAASIAISDDGVQTAVDEALH